MIDVQFLRYFPFFEHLKETELAEIAPLFITRTYEKGANVFFEEEEGDELYIIKSGVVKIYRDDKAREIILAIFREGDFFGEMAVLQNERVRSASARTLEKTTLYVLKRYDFISLLNRSPGIFIKILETALDRLRKANELITDLTILDARTRIVRMILRLIENHGRKNREGVLIDLKLTHQQIADMTGTVRETVTKILLDLQNQQLIRIDKKKIIIHDVEKLTLMLDS
ncbi:Crp/Fnr family transcriptional regulator [Aneurinibacillus sp. REN35]|uniref:Crp/Fnr family transcriptional regulator n=1 Tax=Aneurinibacillus sp. REN35 TaxID=3237286 RepID=UPI0035275E49